MKNLFEKKINKILIWWIIGTAILSGFGMSNKWKWIIRKIKEKISKQVTYIKRGYNDLKTTLREKLSWKFTRKK